jgi:hypothetical protein
VALSHKGTGRRGWSSSPPCWPRTAAEATSRDPGQLRLHPHRIEVLPAQETYANVVATMTDERFARVLARDATIVQTTEAPGKDFAERKGILDRAARSLQFAGPAREP